MTTDPVALLDDEDDVEGHGLIELAAGLGAAAVLAGGAAGATSLLSSSTASHPTSGPVQQVVQEVQQQVGAGFENHGRGHVVISQAQDTVRSEAGKLPPVDASTDTARITPPALDTRVLTAKAQAAVTGAVEELRETVPGPQTPPPPHPG